MPPRVTLEDTIIEMKMQVKSIQREATKASK
jgi:hypothetical protein